MCRNKLEYVRIIRKLSESGAGAGSARWPMALESLVYTKQRGDTKLGRW